MAGRVELVLPGLFDLPPAEITPALQADLVALNRILRLARLHPNQDYSVDAMLWRALGIEAPSGEEFSSLPLAQAAAPERRAERLLLFQAVHLQPDLHNAIIVPIVKNERNLEDICIIINDLQDLFKVDFDITVIANGLFLLELHELDAPTFYPHPLSVLGKAANPYVEQSRHSLDWYRLLNEVQMFLHQHEINQLRQRDALLPINSLWFWGGGPPPRPPQNNLACYCDDQELAQFMRNLGLATASVGDIAELPASKDALVVDLRLLELLKDGQGRGLETLLLEIENQLLQPLMQLSERDGKSLLLRSGADQDFELNRFARLRFWRRPRNLLDWLEPN